MNSLFRSLFSNSDTLENLWILCPFAGGSLSAFKTWMSLESNVFPANSHVLMATYPGRDHRIAETPCASIKELAKEIANEFIHYLHLQSQKPQQIILCGHSMGAQVAYEIYLEISRQHPQILLTTHLVLSACHAPHLTSRRLLNHLDDESFFNELIAIGGCSPSLAEHPELLDIFLPMLRADFTATESYQLVLSKPPTPSCISSSMLIYGLNDPEASESEVAAWRLWLMKQDSTTPCLLGFPGDHFYITTHPQKFIEQVLTTLSQAKHTFENKILDADIVIGETA